MLEDDRLASAFVGEPGADTSEGEQLEMLLSTTVAPGVAAPLRTTSYEPKQVAHLPLFQGNVVEHESGDIRWVTGLDFCHLDVQQLYSFAYSAAVEARAVGDQTALLPPSPDYDGDETTNGEQVARYVHGMSQLYSAVPVVPQPFELLDVVVTKMARNVSSTITSSTKEDPEALLRRMQQAHQAHQPVSAVVPNVSRDTEALLLGFIVGSSNTSTESLQSAIAHLQRCPEIALHFSADLVSSTLDSLLQGSQQPKLPPNFELSVSFITQLVVLRASLSEVLKLLTLLEHLSPAVALHPAIAGVVESLKLTPTEHALLSNRNCQSFSPVSISLAEGIQVSCFAVHELRQKVAVVTSTGLLFYDMNSHATFTLNDQKYTNCWNLVFDTSGSKLVFSRKGGTSHTILSTAGDKLAPIEECEFDALKIPLIDDSGALQWLDPPFMPFGRRSSLFLSSPLMRPLLTMELKGYAASDTFVFVAWVYEDSNAVIMQLTGAQGESLSVAVRDRIVTLSHSRNSTCSAPLLGHGWVFLAATWTSGIWSLTQNHVQCHLSGVIDTARTPRSLQPQTASFFRGFCHFGPVACWSGCPDRDTVQQFFVNPSCPLAVPSEQVVSLAFHLPLDEGCGFWVKELATRSVLSMTCTFPDLVMWDSNVSVPATASQTPTLPLPASVVAQCALRISPGELLMTQTYKNDNDAASDAKNKLCDSMACVHFVVSPVTRQIQFMETYITNDDSVALYYFDMSKTRMFMYLSRFATFWMSSLRVPYDHRTEADSLFTSAKGKGAEEGNTASSVLHRIYLALHRDAPLLAQDPVFVNKLDHQTMISTVTILRSSTSTTIPLKLVALIRLVLAHFAHLKDPSSNALMASLLQPVIKELLTVFVSGPVHAGLQKLYDVGVSQSLGPEEKGEFLASEESQNRIDLVISHLEKCSIIVIVRALCERNTALLSRVIKRLLAFCREEAEREPPLSKVASHMTWFTIAIFENAQRMPALGAATVVNDFLLQLLTASSGLLKKRNWADSCAETFLGSAVVPALLLASSGPGRVSEAVVEEALKLLCAAPAGPTAPGKVSFYVRRGIDLQPTASPWRIGDELLGTSSVTITRHKGGDLTVASIPPRGEAVTKSATNAEPTVRMPGGKIMIVGSGPASVTLMSYVELELPVDWASQMRSVLINFIIGRARGLLTPPPPSDIFMAPLMRLGLNTRALREAGIENITRGADDALGKAILYGQTEEGKEIIEHAMTAMKGLATASMRTTLQGILAVLTAFGPPEHAIDELKLRWFGGEWGSKLQGEHNAVARQELTSLCEWIVLNIARPQRSGPASDTPTLSRRASNDRRFSEVSDSRKGLSNSQRRRSGGRTTTCAEALDHLRALFSKGMSHKAFHNMLASRTRAAIDSCAGLELIQRLLATKRVGASNIQEQMLDLLFVFSGRGQAHFVDNLVGCGIDIELNVRRAFHSVLDTLLGTILSGPAESRLLQPFRTLTEVVPNGRIHLKLMSIICHPWDCNDADFILGAAPSTPSALERSLQPFDAQNASTNSKLLMALYNYFSMPFGTTMSAPVRLKKTITFRMEFSKELESKSDVLSMADISSLSRLLWNSFSVALPGVQFSSTPNGIGVERNMSGFVTIRADEGWPVTWQEAVPRLFYFEVILEGDFTRFQLMLWGQHVAITSNMLNSAANVLSYEHTGTISNMGRSMVGPPYRKGDCIGIGVISATRQVFIALNGEYFGIAGVMTSSDGCIYPAVGIENSDTTRFVVNFGTAPFHFDFRQLHPALSLPSGPTWHGVSDACGHVLHFLACRACAIFDPRRPSSANLLLTIAHIIATDIRRLTDTLRELTSGEAEVDANIRVRHTIIITIIESLMLQHVGTMRHITQVVPDIPAPNNGDLCNLLFGALTELVCVPINSVRAITLGLLPEVLPQLKNYGEKPERDALVSLMFQLAKKPFLDKQAENVVFSPCWVQCDPRSIAITSTSTASMLAEAQRSIVLGTVLPRTGVTSFTITVSRENLSKSHSLQGGYYLGVAVSNLAPLSPPNNSQPWKTQKPPTVWALHDTTPQLCHATNPSVKNNNFHRAFGSGEQIKVVVDRDRGIISFYREGLFLKDLYSGVPADIDISPFCQLYNADASAVIGRGETTAPITAQDLIGAASIDVLRRMLTLPFLDECVADHLCEELRTDAWPMVTMGVVGCLPDPRELMWRHPGGGTRVTVRRVVADRCQFRLMYSDVSMFDHLQSLHVLQEPVMQGEEGLVDRGKFTSNSGIGRIVAALTKATAKLAWPLVCEYAVEAEETMARNKLLADEGFAWDGLFVKHRALVFRHNFQYNLDVQSVPQLLALPMPALGHVFSPSLCHSGYVFPRQFSCRLGTVPLSAGDGPFCGIGEPAIPNHGKYSLRGMMLRGHFAQILGGGYYFGVCTGNFTSKRRELNMTPPDIWALHDMDDAPWRLRHLVRDRKLPIAADPNCVVLSGDIIRLEIDRDEGTMFAYRKPTNAAEEVAIGLLFDNLPKGIELFPFVQLYNTDAIAVLLPSQPKTSIVRTPMQKARLAVNFRPKPDKTFKCDGCAVQHKETRLSPPDWFKCNECADYELCPSCFHSCLHPHHTFSCMDVNVFLGSTLPPSSISPNMAVLVSASPLHYLASYNCSMNHAEIDTVARALEDDAVVVWGLSTHTQYPPVFSVRFERPDMVSLPTPRTDFVGVGLLDDVVALTPEQLRARCVAQHSTIISFASDPRIRQKFMQPSRSPHGFSHGDSLMISVSFGSCTAKVHRENLMVGSLPLPPAFRASSPLVGFCIIGNADTTVSAFPECTQKLLATVSRVLSPRCFRVSTATGAARWISIRECRNPFWPLLSTPPTVPAGSPLFAMSEKDSSLVPCEMVDAQGENDTVTVTIAQEQTTVPVSRLFYSPTPVTALVSDTMLVSKIRSGTVGAGFIITRALMTLIRLLQNFEVSEVVMPHVRELVPLLSRLATVELIRSGESIHKSFENAIRSAFAITSVVTRGTGLLNDPMDALIPVAQSFAKDRIAVDSLVLVVEGPAAGRVGRIVKLVGGEKVVLEDIRTKEELSATPRTIVPVKQSGRSLWWENSAEGLPANLVEYYRRADPATTATGWLLPKEWQGEMTSSNNAASFSIMIALTVVEPGRPDNVIGSARVTLVDGRSLPCTVKCVHERATRHIKVTVSYDQVGPHLTDLELRNALKCFNISKPNCTREEMISSLEKLYAGTPNPFWFLWGALDYEGERITGRWKHSDGLSGVFTLTAPTCFAVAPKQLQNQVEAIPDVTEPKIPVAEALAISQQVHQLVVLLARHLRLLYYTKQRDLPDGEILGQLISFHSHPLARDYVKLLLEKHASLFYHLLVEAISLLHDTKMMPWDMETLSNIVAQSVLLRQKNTTLSPCLFWDSVHAVICAGQRSGKTFRPIILRRVALLLKQYAKEPIVQHLLGPLRSWVEANAGNRLSKVTASPEICCAVELIVETCNKDVIRVSPLPMAAMCCLEDLAESIRTRVPVCAAVDNCLPKASSLPRPEVLCPFGEFNGQDLTVGKVMSSKTVKTTGRYYYEVILPDRSTAPYAVGWGTAQHMDVAGQHVGSDVHSWAFNGHQVVMRGVKEDYPITTDGSVIGMVIGCLLDISERTVAWSVNGQVGPLLYFPLDNLDTPITAFASTGSCAGMKIRMSAEDMQYLPFGFTDISGQTTRVSIEHFDAAERSTTEPKPVSFYAALALIMSTHGCVRDPLQFVSNADLATTYPILQSVPPATLARYVSHILAAQSCMEESQRFVELGEAIVRGSLAQAFLFARQMVTSTFRKQLISIPPLQKSPTTVQQVTIRWTELTSSLPRSPQAALQHTVLNQLHRQIGSFSPKQLEQTPLFQTHLVLTASRHVPQDVGGPYRQVWTLLAEELMTHPDRCHPHTEFHRNPMFRFVNNAQKMCLVPDHEACAPHELALFQFLGKLMGHNARARTPLGLDLSPFVWKYLVEDPLTIEDYFRDVDSVVAQSLRDDEFLLSDFANDVIPQFHSVKLNMMRRRSTAKVIAVEPDAELGEFRDAATEALLHCMDQQLSAMRQGLWSTLGRRALRTMSWEDLERFVCGEPNITVEMLQANMAVQLTGSREAWLWKILEELTGEQRSLLLYFATGQRRLPIVKHVRVVENTESIDHLPRAQSCSSLLSLPLYPTFEAFRAKLIAALDHASEMELA